MKRAVAEKIPKHGARGVPVRADLDLQKGKTSTDWRVGPSLGPAVWAVPCVGPVGSELSRASSTQPRPVPLPRLPLTVQECAPRLAGMGGFGLIIRRDGILA